MLNHLGERLVVGDRATSLNVEKRVAGPMDPAVAARVASFRLDAGLPVWEYAWGDVRVEKRVLMPHRQNTVHVTYRHLQGSDVDSSCRPPCTFAAMRNLSNTRSKRADEDRVHRRRRPAACT